MAVEEREDHDTAGRDSTACAFLPRASACAGRLDGSASRPAARARQSPCRRRPARSRRATAIRQRR
jgi:hypothetical protein